MMMLHDDVGDVTRCVAQGEGRRLNAGRDSQLGGRGLKAVLADLDVALPCQQWRDVW